MVVSCADPGTFARGRGGGSEKNSDNVFYASAFLPFHRGESMVYFKENYIFKVPEGVQHFTGEGIQIFPGGGGGGGQMLI